MPRGGKREGAGRKGPPHATRSLRLPVGLWSGLADAAEDINAKGEGPATVNSLVRSAVELWLSIDRQEQADAKREAARVSIRNVETNGAIPKKRRRS